MGRLGIIGLGHIECVCHGLTEFPFEPKLVGVAGGRGIQDYGDLGPVEPRPRRETVAATLMFFGKILTASLAGPE